MKAYNYKFKRKISEKIRFFREKSHLTQVQLAKKLNVSQTLISKWEHAEREPDLILLREICLIFDVSADELLELETDKQRKEVYDKIYHTNTKN